MNFRNMALFQA